MDIIDRMYSINKVVNSPIEATELEENLCKELSDLLSVKEQSILIKYLDEVHNNYLKKIEITYSEGFKDCSRIINQMKSY